VTDPTQGADLAGQRATAAEKDLPANEPASGPDGGNLDDDNSVGHFDDLISRLKELGPHMRPAEKRVAEVVLGDVEFAVRASNAKLAQLAKVSEPTVTRFCRALGCEGVRDFKLRLAQSLVVGPVYLRSPPPLHGTGTLPYWNAVFHHAGTAISLAERQLDKTKVAAAVEMLSKSGRVFVFGVGGGSTTLAQDAQYRLFRYGLSVTAYSDPLLMRMVATTVGPGDVVMALSATGRADDVIDAARIAQQYHGKVLAITRPETELARLADIALTIKIPDIANVMKPTASRYAFLVTIDLLATGIGYQIGDDAQENLRRIKYNLMNLREGDILEPLGD
jgi:DNA-binding MurR/RpiR family transcriptional regulator